MATRIVETSALQPASNPHDKSYFAIQSNSSDQDDQGLTLRSFTSDMGSSSPPPPDLPTWDTVPVRNGLTILQPSFESGYDFRPGPRIDGRAFELTWLDQDGSEDYDPKCIRDPYLRPPIEIFEGRKNKRPDHSDLEHNRSKVQRTTTWQRGRLEGKRLPVTLSFVTKKGREALKSYGSALDNWPKSTWVPLGEEIDWDSWWNHVLLSDDDDAWLGRKPGQSRRPKRALPGQDSCGDAKLRDVNELTLGHPEARGCKGCFELRQRCPLLDEGNRYPCDFCVEDDQDCELVTEPLRKGACLNCGRRRIRCSYREQGGDRSQPCSHCAIKGLKCVAGPASGRTRTGPALDSAVPSRLVAMTRTFTNCTQCRKAKKRCSLAKNKTAKKCNECIKNNNHCTVEPIQRTNARVRCVKKIFTQFQNSSFNAPRPASNVAQLIKTQLAHPIELNYIGDEPCQWCADVGHGIVGLGAALEVEVMDFNDGNGYVELGGGYFDATASPSHMCDECTFERLAIAACLKHDRQEIKEIPGMDLLYDDSCDVLDYLMPGKAATAPWTWCSICPSPAFYACCKPTDSEMTELDAVESVGQNYGCGLKLCDVCAESLVSEKGGNLEDLVEGKRQMDDNGMSLRADVDLLLPSGELVRRIGGR